MAVALITPFQAQPKKKGCIINCTMLLQRPVGVLLRIFKNRLIKAWKLAVLGLSIYLYGSTKVFGHIRSQKFSFFGWNLFHSRTGPRLHSCLYGQIRGKLSKMFSVLPPSASLPGKNHHHHQSLGSAGMFQEGLPRATVPPSGSREPQLQLSEGEPAAQLAQEGLLTITTIACQACDRPGDQVCQARV